jgi:hypothetical protein
MEGIEGAKLIAGRTLGRESRSEGSTRTGCLDSLRRRQRSRYFASCIPRHSALAHELV